VGQNIPPPPWYRRRGYLHFDPPLGIRRAKTLVTRRSRVAKHAFYPFIKYHLISEKIAKEKGSNKLETKTKHRPIAYAAHADSHIYAYYAFTIGRKYEEAIKKRGIDDAVLAFRSLGKSNIEFARDAFADILLRGDCDVVGLDVSAFFDELDHEILKQKWIGLLGENKLPEDHYRVFRSITHWSCVDRDAVYKAFGISANNPKAGRHRICLPEQFREKVRNGGLIKTNEEGKGIPQGSPISALLSNLYMIDFDAEIRQFVSGLGGRYYRYCDDILLIVPPGCKSDALAFLKDKITTLKLIVHPKKTTEHEFRTKGTQLLADRPLQYLGFLFDGRQAIIRSAALARYSERMKRAVRLTKKTQLKRNRLKHEQGAPSKPIYKRRLYARFSHLGRRNFVTYGLRAAKILNSNAIRSQLKPLWGRLEEEIKG